MCLECHCSHIKCTYIYILMNLHVPWSYCCMLILRVQWFVLFGQEVLVQVVHLDAMYFAFWILAREPEVDSMLPYQKHNRALQASQEISHFVPVQVTSPCKINIQNRLFLPPGHNCPSPHFATCKRSTFSGLGRQIKIESHQSQIQKCSLESR